MPSENGQNRILKIMPPPYIYIYIERERERERERELLQFAIKGLNLFFAYA